MRPEYLERLRASQFKDLPPWLFVTSPELARAIGVHIQTLANWRLRGKGPSAAPTEWFRGRASRYNLGHVWAWCQEKAGRVAQAPWEINADWLKDHMDFEPWEDRERVQKRVTLMMKSAREFRPEEMTRVGREGVGLMA